MTDTLAQRLREALGPDYSLEHELGGGGMSRVFVATESALGRRVVVKVLPPDLAAGVNKERFRREIQLAAQLQHPHIVPLLTAGERGDLLWFTMPFIEGESLRAILDRRGALSSREVMRILHNIVDALAYAHSRGVVHRDIKPGNILMSGSHAVVTDFGVAKALSAAIPLAGHTTSGMAIGTPAYMAPEQLAADPNADHRVDLYAVGLLAYELLTGASPFSGKSPQATLAAQLTVRPTAPHITRPDIPGPLSDVIMQCLEKDADKRPQTAAALLEALDRAAAQVSGEIAGAQGALSQRRAMGVLALLLVATTVFVLTRSRSNAPVGSGLGDSIERAAVAETVVRYIPVGGDQAEGISLQAVLTPAESLAIAQKYLGEGGSMSTPDAINRDSLVAQISRVFADSMQRAIARMESALENLPRQQQLQQMFSQPSTAAAAQTSQAAPSAVTGSVPPSSRVAPPRSAADSARARAFAEQQARLASTTPLLMPPEPGTRRLAILPFTNRTRDSTLDGFGAMVLDSVDAALQGSLGRLEIIAPDVTTRLFGERREGRANSVAAGFALRANYVLGGVYFLRNDSLVMLTLITDVQGGTETRAHEVVVPVARAASAAPSTATWVRARLDSLRREDIRRTRDPNGGPRVESRREGGPPRQPTPESGLERGPVPPPTRDDASRATLPVDR